MPKGVRKSITLPGILAETVVKRYREFDCPSFSPYGVELICYELRKCSPHSLTVALAGDNWSAQDAVDRELVRRYRPKSKRGGLLQELVERVAEINRIAAEARDLERLPPKSAQAERITLPALLWPVIDQRWRDLNYPSFSAYVTGLVRYDLMLGGPHVYHGKDSDPAVQLALDHETLAIVRAGKSKKTYLDYLIERAYNREMSDEERVVVKSEIAKKLCRDLPL
jgi:hypothetical protein